MPRIEKNKKSRGHCFTIHNYTPAIIAHVKEYSKKCVYMIFGLEVAPTTGTKHIQGYLFMTNRRVSRPICKALKASWSTCADGSPEQNRVYCTKECTDLFESGILPKQGKRSDLEAVRDAIMESKHGLDDYDLAEDHINVHSRYGQYCDKLQRMYHPPKMLRRIKNVWIHGETRTGKTWEARQMAPNHFKKTTTKWWDGYNRQKDIIINDLDPSHKLEMGSLLKIWCEHEPFNAEIKNSMRLIRPKRIIVTSQYSIDEMGWDRKMTEAIKERFPIVIHKTERHTYVADEEYQTDTSEDEEEEVMEEEQGEDLI